MKRPRFIARLVELRPGETRIALLAFVILFLTSAGYTVLETARDALLVTKLPQHEFALAYIAVAAVALPAASILSRVSHRWDPRRVLLTILLIAAASVLAFTLLPLRGAVVVGFYVIVGLVSSAIFPQFWVLLGAQLTVGQGRRLIGPIASASVLGAVLGAGLAAGAFAVVPVRGLLVMGSAILAASAAAAFFVPRLPSRERPPSSGGNPPLARQMNAFREEPFLLRVAVLVAATTAAALVIDYLFKSTIARTIPAPSRGAFIARYYAVVNVIALIVQVFFGSLIVRGLGVAAAMVLTPLLAVLGGAAALAASAFALPVLILKAADGSLRTSINRLTTELVYLPVSASGRERAKPFIDGALVRIAQAVTAGALLGLGASHLLSPFILSALVVFFALVWLVAALTMRKHYLGQLRRSVGPALIDDGGSVEFDLPSAELVIEHLGSDDPQIVVAAMNMLDRRGRPRLIPALVLRHPDQQVLRRALEIFALAPSTRTDWHTLAGGLVEHADDGVRIAAASALAAQGKLDFDRLAKDPSPAVRGYAALHAALVGSHENLVEAPQVAEVLGGDPDALTGLLVAVADAEPSPKVARVLLALADLDVPPNAGAWADLLAKATVRHGEVEMIPRLIERLSSWQGRESLRRALVVLGEPAFVQVAAALEDPARRRRLRVHLPQTLGRYGTAAAALHLLDRVEHEPDGLVRYKSLRALARLVSESRIKLDRERIERCLHANLVTYFTLLGLRVSLGKSPSVENRAQASTFHLLAGLLDDKVRQALERAFRLLKVAYPKEDIHRVYTACIGLDKHARANASEFLDALLRKRHQEVLRELFRIVADDLAPSAQVTRAAVLLEFTTPRSPDEAIQAALADPDIKVAALAALYAVAAGGALGDAVQAAQARRPSLAPATRGIFRNAIADAIPMPNVPVSMR